MWFVRCACGRPPSSRAGSSSLVLVSRSTLASASASAPPRASASRVGIVLTPRLPLPITHHWTRRTIWSTVALDGTQLPRHKRRYRNALLSLGFVVVVLALSEYITSNYLKSSTPYRHSLSLVQHSPEVQALLGMPIVPGLTVSSKRNMALLRLYYAVHGPQGSADVEVTSVTSLKNVTLLRLVVTAQQQSIVLVDKRAADTQTPETS